MLNHYSIILNNKKSESDARGWTINFVHSKTERLHLELVGKSNSIQIHFLSLTHGRTHTHTQVHMKSSITCSVHIVSLRIQD